MADLRRTIEIIFAGVDDLSGPLSSMEGSLNKFGDGLQDIGQPFADAVEKVAMLNAAIAGITIAGIAASSAIENGAAKMQAALGLPTEEAERFAEIAKEVYKAGYGEDLAAAFEAVTLAQQKLGDSAETDIGKVVEQAFRLERVFGTDINESLGAVSTLMSNFGLTSDEAMGFIVSGFQEGLNGSDDFLESINEYSTQFANGGADAGNFFSVMESGFQEGMLGTDRAADAFKEFRVRIQDESKTTNEALQSLGIDPVEFAAKMASGELTAVEAFNVIQAALNDTENETVKFNAGVGLMGTQFEDLGTRAALAINTTSTKIGELGDAVNGIDTQTFSEKFTSALRTITTEFGDMTVWEDIKDDIADIFLDIAHSFDEAIDQTDFSGVKAAFGEIWDVMQSSLSDQDLDITTVEGMKNALELVADSLGTVANITRGIVEAFDPVFDIVLNITQAFNDLDPDMQELIGNIAGMGAALGILGGVIATGGALLGGISTFVGFFSAGSAMSVGISSIIALLTGPVGLAAAMAVVANAGVTFFTSETFQNWAVDTKTAIADADFGVWAEKTAGYFRDVNTASTENLSGMDASLLTTGKNAEDTGVSVEDLSKEIHDIPVDKQTEFSILDDDESLESIVAGVDGIPVDKQTRFSILEDGESILGVKDSINDAIPDEKKTKAGAEPDKPSLADTKAEIEENIPFQKTTLGGAMPDTASLKSTRAAIDDAVPESKMMEIQLQGDIDERLETIKSNAALTQTAFEWTAKLNIEHIQADAKVAASAFDSVADSVAATASAAASMTGALGDAGLHFYEIYRLIQEQMRMEQQALNTQRDLVDAQIEYMSAKTEALKGEDPLIRIDSSGLEQVAEQFMWLMLQKIQIRATEEASEFLLGLGI